MYKTQVFYRVFCADEQTKPCSPSSLTHLNTFPFVSNADDEIANKLMLYKVQRRWINVISDFFRFYRCCCCLFYAACSYRKQHSYITTGWSSGRKNNYNVQWTIIKILSYHLVKIRWNWKRPETDFLLPSTSHNNHHIKFHCILKNFFVAVCTLWGGIIEKTRVCFTSC